MGLFKSKKKQDRYEYEDEDDWFTPPPIIDDYTVIPYEGNPYKLEEEDEFKEEKELYNSNLLGIHIEKIKNGYLIHIKDKKIFAETLWDLPNIIEENWNE